MVSKSKKINFNIILLGRLIIEKRESENWKLSKKEFNLKAFFQKYHFLERKKMTSKIR